MHLLVFHAYQRQEVISLARLSSSHYHNHKSKENILKFNEPQTRSHAHCKAHHTCETVRNYMHTLLRTSTKTILFTDS